MQLQQHQQKQVMPTLVNTKLDVDLKSVNSPALARLIDEVRNKDAITLGAYDRAHNRHNR
ncbi:YhhA family cyclophane-containing RiPP [Polaromonas sp.]|uniref:YhhA family cyclophane-containing RiPP n=1 Tax=Polaromonas sp. TaxID=1869339 RepID=UPI003569E653